MPVNLQHTVLGPKTVLRDNSIFVDEDLIIEGTINVRSIEMGNNALIVGGDANVTCETDIVAREIVVLGRAKANLRASHEIMVGEKGVVEGNIAAPRIKIDPTATVTGLLRH